MSRTIRRQSGNRFWLTNQKRYDWKTGEHVPFYTEKFIRQIKGDTYKYWSQGRYIKQGVAHSRRALQKAQMVKLKKCCVETYYDDFDYDPSGEISNSMHVYADVR